MLPTPNQPNSALLLGVVEQQPWAREQQDIHFPKLATTHAANRMPGAVTAAPQRSTLPPLVETDTCPSVNGENPPISRHDRGQVTSEFTPTQRPSQPYLSAF